MNKTIVLAGVLSLAAVSAAETDWTKTPGRITAEWRDGKAHWRVCGYADIAARRPMRADALFWAASNTKGIAAALVLTFVDDGAIELDAPVERYFPQWRDIRVVSNPEGGRETRRVPKTKPTVRQLLSHMSGLAFFPEMPIDRYSMRELVDVAVSRGLAAEPGETFIYSNWGIDVAVAIAEKVGGKPWDVLLKERVLDPLGMRGATFWPSRAEQARLVVPYHFPADGGDPVRGTGVTQFSAEIENRALRHAEAGGGLYATADDFLRFFAMVANRGVGIDGRRVLSERICREWYRRQTPPHVKQSYSFGMFVDPEKGTLSHAGAYATDGEADWKNRTCKVTLVQKCGRPASVRRPPASAYDPVGVEVGDDGVTLETTGETVWTDDFSNRDGTWTVHFNYGGHLAFAFDADGHGRKGLVVRGFRTNKVDSAWSVRSKRRPLAKPGTGFVLLVDIASDRTLAPGANNESHGNMIHWYDAAGARLAAEPFNLTRLPGGWGEARHAGRIPAGAAFYMLQLGFDGPNLFDGATAAYRNLRFSVTDETKRYVRAGRFTSGFVKAGALSWRAVTPEGTSVSVTASAEGCPAGYVRYAAALASDGTATPRLTAVRVGAAEHDCWTREIDLDPPCVLRTSPSPTQDPTRRLTFSVADASGVDWSTLDVRLDGKPATDLFVRAGDGLVQKVPVAAWSDGLHACDITLADFRGNKATARTRFFVGDPARTPKVTLRDDGVTLVDGTPFFPIGMYGVMRREFNGNDFARAFDGLAAGGFNTSHSYSETFDADYLKQAAAHGFRIIQFGRLPDHRMMTKSRFDPTVLAWYLGDDTSVCSKPWELRDYDAGMRAVDPNRLTCQADLVWKYGRYAAWTDVFLPELYPLRKDSPGERRKCAAEVVDHMRRIAADNARYGGGRVHAVWPIIQYFKGWGWDCFPEKDELYAMTFAALCNGGKGVSWYAYCGVVDPAKKKFNYGVTSSPERWKTICGLATFIAGLSPVLLERDVPMMKPAYLKGPGRDPLGNEPVSTMMKRHGGHLYLFAVNTADAPVTVRYPVTAETVSVYGGGKNLSVASDGFTDELPPLGVRIYRLTGG